MDCSAAGVEFIRDLNGVITHVQLRSPDGDSARVSLHGGQLLSWKTERGQELLFTSSKGTSKPPAAVRGGISICFPQYGNCGSLKEHGFARNRTWTIDENPPPLPNSARCSSTTFVDLLLKSSNDDLKIWNHSSELRLRVIFTADGSLSLISRVRSVDSKPFSFTSGFHTYFSVSDISEVRVEGLETLDYLDNLHSKEQHTEQGDALTFESEVDRVYLGSLPTVAIFDHDKRRTYYIRKEGFPDIVVWNPWERKSKAMPDFAAEEYRKMLCVDAALVEKPISLKPGDEWIAQLDLSVSDSNLIRDSKNVMKS